jgi:hypothetical protein
MKDVYGKPTVDSVLKGERLSAFLPRLGTRQECFLLIIFVILRFFDNAIRQKTMNTDCIGRSEIVFLCR